MNDQDQDFDGKPNPQIHESHFVMGIKQIDSGAAIDSADDALRAVLQAVRRTGKKGSVTVTLEVAANGETGFTATARIASKIPQANYGQSFFFTDPNGNLTRISPAFSFQGGSQGKIGI